MAEDDQGHEHGADGRFQAKGKGGRSAKQENEKRYQAKAAAVRQKLGAERIQKIQGLVKDLLPRYSHVDIPVFGRVKAHHPTVPGNVLVDEMARAGLGEAWKPWQLLDAMVFASLLAEHKTGDSRGGKRISYSLPPGSHAERFSEHPDVAGRGAAPDRVEQLLRRSLRLGTATLGSLVYQAARRLLQDPTSALSANRLFTDAERGQLAEALASVQGTADLLGRADVRRRLAQQEGERFSEPPWESFQERGGVKPMAPLEALEYFRSLIPMLGVDDPGRWADDRHRVAFTAAAATDETLLGKIQGLILQALETGKNVRATPAAIDDLLEAAGCSPANPQYAEMVTRTNLMDAYVTGAERERQHPDVREAFPAWQYLGIHDGRQGADHEPHFGKYYPAHVAFADVRGPRIFNCRCLPRPVHRREWARLQEQGHEFATFAEDIPVPEVAQETPYSCGPACLKAVARLYGRDIGREQAYIDLCHATPEDGTPPANLVRAARALGLVCEAHEGMTLSQLEREIILGHPVVICFQAWGSPKWYAVDESGHWAVACGRDAGTIHFEDPAGEAKRIEVPKADLLRRWHDKDGQGRRFVRFGVVFRGLRRDFAESHYDPDEPRDESGRWTKGGVGYKKPNAKLPAAARPDLNAAEASAIKSYTDEAYDSLNQTLREGGSLSGHLKEVDEGLQAALAKTKPFQEPVQVLRGLNLSGEKAQAFLAKARAAQADGKGLQFGGYLSTTTNDRVVEGAGIRLEISAIRGLDVRSFSQHEHEDELLLDRDSRFEVLGVEKAGRNDEYDWLVKVRQVAGKSEPMSERRDGQIAGQASSRFVDGDASHIVVVDLPLRPAE